MMKMSQPFMVEVVCWRKRYGRMRVPGAADVGAIARTGWWSVLHAAGGRREGGMGRKIFLRGSRRYCGVCLCRSHNNGVGADLAWLR